VDACYCKCITYKLGRIHLLKPSACLRVRGADAAGSLQDCFTAPGVLKSGYDQWGAYTAQSALNSYGIQMLTSRAKECGLPASTVKLSPPPSNTCEGVMYTIQSVNRCCAPVCLRGRVSVFVHLCGWVDGVWGVGVGVFVCVKTMMMCVMRMYPYENIYLRVCVTCLRACVRERDDDAHVYA
jgi:hypothetical protein